MKTAQQFQSQGCCCRSFIGWICLGIRRPLCSCTGRKSKADVFKPVPVGKSFCRLARHQQCQGPGLNCHLAQPMWLKSTAQAVVLTPPISHLHPGEVTNEKGRDVDRVSQNLPCCMERNSTLRAY